MTVPAAALLLVRHGESTWNAEHRMQGQADPPLSALGRAQAHEIVELVRGLGPERAVCSDLSRAAETAAILGFGGATRDARWRELHMGTWQGRLAAGIRSEDDAAFVAWRAGERGAPGGETFPQMNERVAEAARELLGRGGTTLVVCHGGPIRSVCTAVLGIPRSQLAALGNCSLTVIRQDAGRPGPRLAAYNCGPSGPALPQRGI